VKCILERGRLRLTAKELLQPFVGGWPKRHNHGDTRCEQPRLIQHHRAAGCWPMSQQALSRFWAGELTWIVRLNVVIANEV